MRTEQHLTNKTIGPDYWINCALWDIQDGTRFNLPSLVARGWERLRYWQEKKERGES